MFESLPDRQKRLLRLVADGLSDAEIAQRVEEPEAAIGQEIKGVLAELGLRTRTHAIVYVLAREISATTKDHRPRAPSAPQPAEEDQPRDAGEPSGRDQERPA